MQIDYMPVVCKNCGSLIEENFCPRCGQKKEVQKITWSFILKEIIHFFTHFEKGFIQTGIKMEANPGHFIKTYLEGQRKDKQSPVSFLIIWAAIFLLTREGLISLFHYKQEDLNVPSFINKEATTYYFSHVAYLTIVFTPIWTFISWSIGGFMKKMNYAEAMVGVFYSFGLFFAILFLITLVLGLIFQINILSNLFSNLYVIAGSLNGFWINHSLMKQFGVRNKLIRNFAIQIIGTIVMIKFMELVTLIVK